MRVAFIGLGVMGYPMAGHLQNGGHDVTVFNRTSSKAVSWCNRYSGKSKPTPAEAVNQSDIVFTCVGNDDDVRAIMFGDDGIIDAVGRDTIIVDHTTTSATVAREIADAAGKRSIGFLDAPLSGGQAGAENGQLTIMVGGDADIVERARPAMTSYAKAITHIGPVGCGQLAKMVNQICIAGVVQGLAEGLHFAKRAGLDPALVIDAISAGAAQSWQMDNRWRTMVDNEFDFGFAVDWMRKDLGIALDEAQQNGALLEMTRMIDAYYAEVQDMGGNRWDTSSLIARLEK